MRFLFVFFVLIPLSLIASNSIDSLVRALEIAEYWDRKLCERFPVTFNHQLSSGYFTTPSARMGEEGEFGFGVASAPPYLHFNLRAQPFSFLELSGNYRIFRNFEDPVLGKSGFGNYADRGANFKIALVTPEASSYALPGIAFGIEDFMGSKKFTNFFIVGTHVWVDYGLEMSLGWGKGRYSNGPSHGFFGGANWFPIRCCGRWLEGLAFSAEYDPINYKNSKKEPHPKGRSSRFPLNVGIKYKYANVLELSASYIRGEKFACAGSAHYNFGRSEGLILKINDPPPYCLSLGCGPSLTCMCSAFETQGFMITKGWIECCGCKKQLWLKMVNGRYHHENVARMRIQCLLAALTPPDIDEVIVIIESFGLPCHQYIYPHYLLADYANHRVCPYEFDLLTPRCEARHACTKEPLIFCRNPERIRGRISPRVETFFGSAVGKFKYDAGVKGSVDGILPGNFYYEAEAGYTLFSDIKHVGDFDILNPSQIPNVATDYINYRKFRTFSFDRIYIQKSANFGCGWFGRAALGYFQVNYAGIAGELLFYPACAPFAIGIEGAVVKKRKYTGLGFQSKLRHFEGTTPVFQSYTTLQQYFLDFYFDFAAWRLFTKISVGQFLARDKGGRVEVTRYFANGIRLTAWMTLTNAYEHVNNQRYYDRGVALEIPFDLFFRCSSRRIWNYGLAAWLRDAGYVTTTGHPLFDSINRERRW